MTPAQIQAFMEWVEARIKVDTGIATEIPAEIAAREAVYASFNFNENGAPVEPEPKPEGRGWQARVHTACGAACRYGVADKAGVWATWADGSVWLSDIRKIAERKAKLLNEMEL